MGTRKRSGSVLEYAHTYNMDTRKLRKPVVLERSERGREMQTSKSVLAMDERNEADRSDTKFHEGYVDGKLYLVPDSNLEAMKDIINLKMRRQESSKYLGVEDTGLAQKRYDQKREELLKKLDAFGFEEEEEEEEDDEESSLTDELDEEEKGEEEENEEEEETVEEEEKNDIVGEEEEETAEEEEKEEEEEDTVEEEEKKETAEEEEEKDESAKEETESEEEVAQEKVAKVSEELAKEPEDEPGTIFPAKFYNPDVQRFLISGHFRTNRKPIYIIQRYAGPSVFGSKDPQFYSQKSERDADVLIAGEFYKETILVEDDNRRPIRLNTRPINIGVDESSLIHEEEFSDTFVGGGLEVALTGRFIRQDHREVPQGSELYTPLLTISVKKASKRGSGSNQNGKPPAPVYVSMPRVRSVFEKDRKKLKQKSKPKKQASSHRKERYAKGGKKNKGETSVYAAMPKVNNVFEKEWKDFKSAAPPLKLSSYHYNTESREGRSKHRNKSHKKSARVLSDRRKRSGSNPGKKNFSQLSNFSSHTDITSPSNRWSKRDEKLSMVENSTNRDGTGTKSSVNKTRKLVKGDNIDDESLYKEGSKPKLTLRINSGSFGPHSIDLETNILRDHKKPGKRKKETDNKPSAAGNLLRRLFSS